MKIPASIITGFLGSGKTTLIRHLMSHATGQRLALIINEFGDLGIDRELLVGCGETECTPRDIIELPNGCICCTVADEFLPTMQRLLDSAEPLDHILIETSGLALPKPLVQAFNWPTVRPRVTVDGVIALIDALAVLEGRFAHDPDAVARERAADLSLDHESALQELYKDQLLCADIVILNKSDLLSPEDLTRVRDRVAAEVRPGTKMVTTSYGSVPAPVVIGLGAGAEADIDNRPSHHEDPDDDHDHDEFVSFTANMGTLEDPAVLDWRIAEASSLHDILRVKGFINVAGKPMRHVVQAVGPRVQRYYDRPWRDNEARLSTLVVIAEKGVDQAAVLKVLAAN